MLKLKNRKENENLKKVLIYGLDGSGKSTFAEQYCQENGLKPVVIDIDDTNYTDLPILDLNLKDDIRTYENIKNAISEISRSKDFDTIILDGVTSLLEMLTSNNPGIVAYSDRAKRWNKILQKLQSSKKHLIFIGQADMRVLYNEDHQSSKAVIKVNSMVNEKYYCYVKGGKYFHEVKKYRTVQKEEDVEVDEMLAEPAFSTANKIKEVENESPVDQETLMEEAKKVATRIAGANKKINKINMKKFTYQLCKDGVIPSEHKEPLYKFIEANCP